MKLRNLLSLILCTCLLLTIFPIPAYGADTQGPQPVFSHMSAAEFNRSAAEDTFASIFQLNRDLPEFDWGPGAPAAGKLTGVTYKLADNVVKIDSAVTQNIRSVEQVAGKKSGSASIDRIIGQGGLLKADLLESTVGQSMIKPGTVFADVDNGLAFKVPSLPGQSADAFNGYVPVVRPSFSEVVKELIIPEQTVHLNQSNVKYFAEDINGNSLSKYLVQPGTTYTMSYTPNKTMEPLKPKHIKNVVTALSLPEGGVTMKGTTRSGSVYNVNINGYLAFGDIGKTKYIVNWQPTILHKRIKDTAGYILSFKEVCAYRDEIWELYTSMDALTDLYLSRTRI